MRSHAPSDSFVWPRPGRANCGRLIAWRIAEPKTQKGRRDNPPDRQDHGLANGRTTPTAIAANIGLPRIIPMNHPIESLNLEARRARAARLLLTSKHHFAGRTKVEKSAARLLSRRPCGPAAPMDAAGAMLTLNSSHYENRRRGAVPEPGLCPQEVLTTHRGGRRGCHEPMNASAAPAAPARAIR